MVLKKSNSGFNTGATQRLRVNGKSCFTRAQRRASSLPNNYIAIARAHDTQLAFWPRELVAQVEEKYLAAERLLIEFLDFGRKLYGPALDNVRVTPPPHDRFLSGLSDSANAFSMERGKRWNLPGRIQEMVQDQDFAEVITQYADVKIRESQERKRVKGLVVTRRQEWSLFDMTQESKDQKGENVKILSKAKEVDMKTSKKCRTICHPRGIQRPAMWGKETPKQKDMTVQTAERPSEVLYINVVHKMHTDARDLNIKRPHKEILYRSRRKTKMKMKHAKSARMKFLQEEINEKATFHIPDNELFPSVLSDQIFEQFCGGDDDDYVPTPSTVFNIMDFCRSQSCIGDGPVRRKRRKSSKCKYPDFSEQQHPNIQYITKEEAFRFLPDVSDMLNNASLKAGHDNEKDLGTLSNINHKDGGSSFESLDAIDSDGHDENSCFLKESENFKKDFIRVKLNLRAEELPWEEVNETTACLSGSGQDVNCDVEFGNCRPACFSIQISLGSENSSSHVVGNQIGEAEWLVSLQFNSKDDQEVINAKKDFTSKVCGKLDRTLDEYDLISTTKDLLFGDKNLEESINNWEEGSVKGWIKEKEAADVTDEVFGVSKRAVVCSAHEAFTLLSKRNTLGDRTANEIEVKQLSQADVSAISECEICLLPLDTSGESDHTALSLLPCRHTFCRNCWTNHAKHAVKRGEAQIPCMMSECPGLMNEVLVRSLLPYTLSCLYQVHLRDRTIDVNPRSSWCPNDRCDKVIVLPDDQPRSGIGRPVVCWCGQSWCPSCREIPHWPTSCEQFKNYTQMRSQNPETGAFILGRVSLPVSVRPCPSCRYPIEKDRGCPRMKCAVCKIYFCWDCMMPFKLHRYDREDHCLPNSVKSVTLVLQNTVVIDHPIEYFLKNCLKYHKRQEETLDPETLRLYLLHLRTRGDYRHIWVTVCNSYADMTKAKKDVVEIVLKAVAFLRKAYAILELNYVLLGLARCNSENRSDYVGKFATILLRLEFIVERIEVKALNQTFVNLFRSVEIQQDLLDKGKTAISEIEKLIPRLQKAATRVKSDWLSTVDPHKYARYK